MRITKKQIAALGYQTAYRKVYLKGKKEAVKDSTIFAELYVKDRESLEVNQVGQFVNISGHDFKIILLLVPKV